jgi:hypothetical protein
MALCAILTVQAETEGLREMWLRSLQLSIYEGANDELLKRKASISANRASTRHVPSLSDEQLL